MRPGCDAASDQRVITPPGSRLRARRTATRNGVCSMGTRVWGVVTTTSVRMLSTRGRATLVGSGVTRPIHHDESQG